MAGNDQLQKRSVRIAGHRTSLALEPEFWAALETEAAWKGRTMPVHLAAIDEQRLKTAPDQSLASAARVSALMFVLHNHKVQSVMFTLADKIDRLKNTKGKTDAA